MSDLFWLVTAAIYGFGMAQVLRLRWFVGLPLLAVTGAVYIVAVNIVSTPVTRLDLSSAWSAGLFLGAFVAIRARRRADRRAERESLEVDRAA
ncbi:hypothetical protein [Promicromonospora sp. NPDC050249]|uniref:hypothetical protein n=1 Tax=Promicromonospora sp. NPDC050249 TaxID=3154743 RepID=UPI0033CD3F24